MMKHLNTFENFLFESSTLKIDDLSRKKLYIDTGSGFIGGSWSKEELIQKLRDVVSQFLFDSEFYHNWTDDKKEYLNAFERETLDPMFKDTDKLLREHFILERRKHPGEILVFVMNNVPITDFNFGKKVRVPFIDNWFKTTKSISQKLRNEYYEYRKEYSGVDSK